MTWIDVIDDNHPSVVELADWLSTLNPRTYLDLVGRMDALKARAARGEIHVPEDGSYQELDAIRKDPDIYELRWTLLSKEIRQYHGEPARHPNHLIALHVHIKGDKVHRELHSHPGQDAEIDTAVKRYRDTSPAR